ncbi:YebC/PmpR family DNA-binding regulatory protein [Natronocella acetinitrilica]|jgi:YebC/PmpR family DNA-binding regulatory protein|uniref:Probable transcriptional regulatory protein J2T57_001180 n=1 Tax=Natronocella acetinitrilica TaxID=414046 RepID=A0AAE3G3K4_9GAMM|nr:YebC/PmpR family DNA-binding transcriptional regulator [Natronocella acetinitrilica]MCP1674081.1 YebC/PmpR family DNA-binding regulatory protein [Natronocella acetinitrilica]
MAGHSKWANIQHRKKAQDAKRGKIFTRMIREIAVAARMGDPDPASNPRLRLAVDRALSVNMPKDNIERAIKRASGQDDSAIYEEIRYEGYGPNGVAVMVDCMTDNRNRTVAEVRHAFSKFGGNLGTDGSVGFLFSKAGVITFPPDTEEDAVMEAALEAGAEDILTNEDGSIEVLTSPDEFMAVRDALQASGLEPADAEVTQRPATTVAVSGDQAATMIKMLDMLEDLDDVQNVYHNADIDQDAYDA